MQHLLQFSLEITNNKLFEGFISYAVSPILMSITMETDIFSSSPFSFKVNSFSVDFGKLHNLQLITIYMLFCTVLSCVKSTTIA